LSEELLVQGALAPRGPVSQASTCSRLELVYGWVEAALDGGLSL
jgi:hypothetical protein